MNFCGLVGIIIIYIVNFFSDFFTTICIEFGRKSYTRGYPLEGLESTPWIHIYAYIYLTKRQGKHYICTHLARGLLLLLLDVDGLSCADLQN